MIDNADIQRIIRDYYEQLYMPIQWTTWKKWTDFFFFLVVFILLFQLEWTLC